MNNYNKSNEMNPIKIIILIVWFILSILSCAIGINNIFNHHTTLGILLIVLQLPWIFYMSVKMFNFIVDNDFE